MASVQALQDYWRSQAPAAAAEQGADLSPARQASRPELAPYPARQRPPEPSPHAPSLPAPAPAVPSAVQMQNRHLLKQNAALSAEIEVLNRRLASLHTCPQPALPTPSAAPGVDAPRTPVSAAAVSAGTITPLDDLEMYRLAQHLTRCAFDCYITSAAFQEEMSSVRCNVDQARGLLKQLAPVLDPRDGITFEHIAWTRVTDPCNLTYRRGTEGYYCNLDKRADAEPVPMTICDVSDEPLPRREGASRYPSPAMTDAQVDAFGRHILETSRPKVSQVYRETTHLDARWTTEQGVRLIRRLERAFSVGAAEKVEHIVWSRVTDPVNLGSNGFDSEAYYRENIATDAPPQRLAGICFPLDGGT